MQAHILRTRFLDFFKSKKHRIVESDSLVPKDDPTVLFTPAGMNQFKREFMGFDSGFKRAATAQRCLRTDDLDKVGKTTGHHTFFEMLGNFSFGDYFKKDAIFWAWEFLTKELKIKEEKLWVSVYKDDLEAYKIWRDLVKVPNRRIVKLGDKENFWPSEAKTKGPNGPCGPCSEIFFDLGKKLGCGKPECGPSCGCGRFVEVWNLVFTQFNRKSTGQLEPLPKKNIDTGMGLERLAAVMQQAPNNFETDLFIPIIKEISFALINAHSLNKGLIYAVADHLRAVSFAIFDGVLPSNETRGYVVRKLIRKSTLNLRTLGIKDPFLYKLVPVLAQAMVSHYPEMRLRQENISEVILAEEKLFISTLNSSGAILKDKFQRFHNNQDPEEVGLVAFQLYDTYGMPLELTAGWLKKQGINISKEEFDKQMEGQRARSKLQSAMKGDVFSIPDTGFGIKDTSFLGYKSYSAKAKVLKIIKDNKEVKRIGKGEAASIILDKTPFYPESGGQAGDSGEIIKGKNIFVVCDTKKTGKVIVHIGKVKSGSLKKNDLVSAQVAIERRLAIARNHTATHLLQAALRKVLGAHVQQQGSLVAPERLRFDFTHFKEVKKEELDRVEEIVNNSIIDCLFVESKEKTLQEAKKSGALAFFGEKYEEKVRVVTVNGISKEFCAGTHLEFTGQIGLFKIIQEGSVASGVRRIEAATGSYAYKRIKEGESILADISKSLNVPADKINHELEKMGMRVKELEKQLSAQKLNALKTSIDKFIEEAETINDTKVIARLIDNSEMDLLRKNVDLIKEKAQNSIVALGSNYRGRALLVMGVTSDLCDKGVDASKLILDIAAIIGGSGGGRKDFAQAGGNNPQNLDKALEELKNIIRNVK
ncbi:MAG: alanine--tRNA ligase [Candidatus Omnitrophota bacterium]